MHNTRFVPAELLDVAGLVPGAHKGKGMGNQFLTDLNQADALIHVIDCSGSTNEKGESVDKGSYNPENDILFLEEELDQWYLGILNKGWEKFARQVQQEHRDISKSLAKQLSGLGVDEDLSKATINELNLNKDAPSSWTEEELLNLAREFRKKTKPIIIAANKIDVPGALETYKNLKEKFQDHIIIPCSAESELALKEAAKHKLIDYISGTNKFAFLDESRLSDKQKEALKFIDATILKRIESTGVQQTIEKAVFEILNYITIFPGGANNLEDQHGNVLPDCFLLKQGSTALDFAYHIHSDIGDKFIRAIDVKTKRTIGKEHILNNRDVIEIITAK